MELHTTCKLLAYVETLRNTSEEMTAFLARLQLILLKPHSVSAGDAQEASVTLIDLETFASITEGTSITAA